MKTAIGITNGDGRRAIIGWLAAMIGCICWMTAANTALAIGAVVQEKQKEQQGQESGQVVAEQETDTDQKSKDAESSEVGGPEQKKVEWPQSEDGWYVVTPEGGNASFSVSTVPRSSKRDMVTVDELPITVHLNVAVDQNRANMVFAWHEQGYPKGVGDIKSTLNGALVGALGMTLGEEISRGEVQVDQNPGLDFQIRFIFKDETMKMASRVILNQNRVFQLTYVAPEAVFSEADHKKFVESFKYLPPPKEPTTPKPESGQPVKPVGQ